MLFLVLSARDCRKLLYRLFHLSSGGYSIRRDVCRETPCLGNLKKLIWVRFSTTAVTLALLRRAVPVVFGHLRSALFETLASFVPRFLGTAGLILGTSTALVCYQ